MIIILRVKSPSDMDDINSRNQEDADLLEYMMQVQSVYHIIGGSIWDDEDDLVTTLLPKEYGDDDDEK